jgi:hypothetical protein
LRSKESAVKDGEGNDNEKARKKKKAEADLKDQGGKPRKTHVPLPLVSVEAELPLSVLDEDEAAAVASQLRNRVTVNEDELPSCAFFTFVNTHQVRRPIWGKSYRSCTVSDMMRSCFSC